MSESAAKSGDAKERTVEEAASNGIVEGGKAVGAEEARVNTDETQDDTGLVEGEGHGLSVDGLKGEAQVLEKEEVMRLEQEERSRRVEWDNLHLDEGEKMRQAELKRSQQAATERLQRTEWEKQWRDDELAREGQERTSEEEEEISRRVDKERSRRAEWERLREEEEDMTRQERFKWAQQVQEERFRRAEWERSQRGFEASTDEDESDRSQISEDDPIPGVVSGNPQHPEGPPERQLIDLPTGKATVVRAKFARFLRAKKEHAIEQRLREETEKEEEKLRQELEERRLRNEERELEEQAIRRQHLMSDMLREREEMAQEEAKRRRESEESAAKAERLNKDEVDRAKMQEKAARRVEDRLIKNLQKQLQREEDRLEKARRSRNLLRDNRGSSYRHTGQGDGERTDGTVSNMLELEMKKSPTEYTFEDLESVGLTKRINTAGSSSPPGSHGGHPESPEWTNPQSILSDGSVTELTVVSHSEYSLDSSGNTKVTITSQGGPPKKQHTTPGSGPVSSPVEYGYRWLHVKQEVLEWEVLKDLITKCPFIDNNLIKVTVTVLSEIALQRLRHADRYSLLEPDFVTRSIGYNGDDDISDETASAVIFVSTSYLRLIEKAGSADKRNNNIMTLLQSLYENDASDEKESTQVINKLKSIQHLQITATPAKGMLHVPQLWCLLVGRGLLITVSELSLTQLRMEFIDIKKRDPQLQEYRNFLIIDRAYREYPITVKRGLSFVEFLGKAVGLVTSRSSGSSDATKYDLYDESDNLLEPDTWLKIMASNPEDDRYITVSLQIRPYSSYAIRNVYSQSERRGPQHERSISTALRRSRKLLRYRSPIRPQAAEPVEQQRPSSIPEIGPRERRHYRLAYEEGLSSHQGINIHSVQKSSPADPNSEERIPIESMQPQVAVERDITPDKSRDEAATETSYQGATETQKDAILDARETDERASVHGTNKGQSDEHNESDRKDKAESNPSSNGEKQGQESVTGADGADGNNDGVGSPSGKQLVRRRDLASSDLAKPSKDGLVTRVLGGFDVDSRHSEVSPLRRREKDYEMDDGRSDGVASGAHQETKVLLHYVRFEEKTETAETRQEVLSSHDEVIRQSNNPPKIPVLPFFCWTTNPIPEDYDSSASGNVVPPQNAPIHILQDIKKSLISTSKGFKYFYEKSFSCTQEELVEKYVDITNESGNYKQSGDRTRPPDKEVASNGTLEQESVLAPGKIDIAGDPSVNMGFEGSKSTEGGVGLGEKDDDTKSTEPINGTTAKDSGSGQLLESQQEVGQKGVAQSGGFTTENGDPSTAPIANPQMGILLSATTNGRGKKLMQQLFAVSEEIFSAFLPVPDIPSWNPVCTKLWGSIDEIFRIIWSVTLTKKEWIVKDFDSSKVRRRKNYAACDSCTSQKRYNSADDALIHLHADHFPQSDPTGNNADNAKRPKYPQEDSYFSWLEWSLDESRAVHEETFDLFEKFVASLRDIQYQTNQLHYLVASASNRGGETHYSRPSLLPELFNAFVEIFRMYVFKSESLFIFNRATASLENPEKYIKYRDKLDATRILGSKACVKAQKLLSDARVNLILSGTIRRDIDSLGVRVVGPEFVVAALLSNVQNLEFDHDPLSTSKDILQTYDEYAAAVRFRANQRPQKRIFMDLHSLEEELDAIRKVTEAQRTVTRNYGLLIAPMSWRNMHPSRKPRFRLENKFIQEQLKKLAERCESLEHKLKRSHKLKESLKQLIEVLEEGHGKAIRVFTIVTLFFLPLSFVTSLMGMNTNDIRNMDSDQSLFWSIAVPVTATVLSLAFIYSYKGEDILDWLRNSVYKPQNPRLQTLQPTGSPHSLSHAITEVARRKLPLQKESLVTPPRRRLVRKSEESKHTRRRTATGLTVESYLRR